MEKIYVDSNGVVFKGAQAETLYRSCNDSQYLTSEGVVKVPLDRWEKEQSYEYNFSMKRQLDMMDDRNLDHYKLFDNYNSIVGMNCGSYIELGCGPFTNTRILIPLLSNVSEIYLLDPLIDSYKTHPNCTYKSGVICGYPVHTLNSSIEKISIDKKFNTVVLINVLEHCYDVPEIMHRILQVLDKGGVFIFSEATFDKDALTDTVFNVYDEGHAIRLSTEFVEKFLSLFKTIYRKDYFGMYEQPMRHDIYFIGRKV